MPCVAETAFNLDTRVFLPVVKSTFGTVHRTCSEPTLLPSNCFIPWKKKTNTQVLVLEAPRTRLLGCYREAGSVTEKVPVGWIGHSARGAAVKIYHGVVLLCEPEQALQQFLLLPCSCSMNPRLKSVVWLSVALADC